MNDHHHELSASGSARSSLAVDAEGLVKRFGRPGSSTVTAVAGVDLQVRRGEVFGVLGPNGAGKTTTLGALDGVRAVAARARETTTWSAFVGWAGGSSAHTLLDERPLAQAPGARVDQGAQQRVGTLTRDGAAVPR